MNSAGQIVIKNILGKNYVFRKLPDGKVELLEKESAERQQKDEKAREQDEKNFINSLKPGEQRDHYVIKGPPVEPEASQWWESLTPEQQKAYLKMHPESYFARVYPNRVKASDPSGDNMQVNAPPEAKPMDQLMPDAGVPSQPFKSKEALMIRPHYLGQEKRYPLTCRVLAAASFLSVDKLRDGLKKEFEAGIEQYRRSGEYVVPVAGFDAQDIVNVTHPDDFLISEDGIKVRQTRGPDEVWVEGDDYHLRDAASDGLLKLISPLRKELWEQFPAELEVENDRSDFILFMIFEAGELPEAKKFAGITQASEEAEPEAVPNPGLEKLNIQEPSEFWASYGGQVRQLAEEHGLGDIMGYSFRPDCIEIVGVERIMDLDYDFKLLQSREIYSTEGV